MKTYLPLAVGAIAAVVAIQHNAAVEIRANQLSGCERGNANRLSDWRAATDEAAREHNLAGQSDDPEVATIHRHAFKDARDRARAIVLTAKDTGAQTSRGSPTIVCTVVYPAPSWWPL